MNRLVQLGGMRDALKPLAPDVLCLQEVQGQHLKRAIAFNEFPDQPQHEWFGEYLALSSSYGANADYAHGHHGNAVLSRHPLDPKHNVNITVNQLEKRGVLHCEIHPAGWTVPLTVLCCHLNLLHRDRAKQYAAIRDYIMGEIDADAPLVLAGDFNDWSKKASDALAELGLTDAYHKHHGCYAKSFPARLPVLPLDRVYMKNLTVLEARVLSGAPWSHLSDHLPLSVKLLPVN